LHIAHVSTQGSVGLIRQAKKQGINVTCEAAPHHLTLTEEAVLGYNTNAKVNPPLRTRQDVDALIDGLNDGTIDIIATDHAPHSLHDKQQEFALSANGISGFETAIGSLLELVHLGKLDMVTLINKLTAAPAKILHKTGLKIGCLKKGYAADITIIDPDLEWLVNPDEFLSLGTNTLLQDRSLKVKQCSPCTRV
jgi:dihydroorotase